MPFEDEHNNGAKQNLRLPKKERLKSKKLFEVIFHNGESVTNFPLRLLYHKTIFEDGTKNKIAVIAPKRNFKSAVKRNRIKRLLREAYRHHKHLAFNNIEGNYALVFLYLGKEMPAYKHVESSLIGVLNKFIKKVAHETME